MAETLGDRLNDDIWVFGYGSLMWDPGFHFSEIRRARITGYRRAMALYDAQGARGTAEAPGLMAALVEGGTVDGVVFRIDAAHAADEVEVVWRREMVGPGYLARFLPAETDQGRVEALAFVGDTTQEDIRPDLPRADIVRYIATGEGILGSSLDYLRNMLIHFREMGIPDPDLEALMDEVLAYRAD
ncbi:hypothetical protein ATO6_19010 [Oceanicola sp. 22II-s10i]|nr:hypothetical protein ATO6_19010 [Oceanicola sp. 22II-s10i]